MTGEAFHRENHWSGVEYAHCSMRICRETRELERREGLKRVIEAARPQPVDRLADMWDRRFIGMAHLIASWSKDPSTKVGCVIVRKDRTIASLGYNGFPRGVYDDAERYADRDGKIARTVHAETNALLNAHERVDGATAYTTFPPCSQCAGLLIQAGIARVVCAATVPERWRENTQLAASMLGEAKVRYDYEVDFV